VVVRARQPPYHRSCSVLRLPVMLDDFFLLIPDDQRETRFFLGLFVG
jgi:hypothetical protein